MNTLYTPDSRPTRYTSDRFELDTARPDECSAGSVLESGTNWLVWLFASDFDYNWQADHEYPPFDTQDYSPAEPVMFRAWYKPDEYYTDLLSKARTRLAQMKKSYGSEAYMIMAIQDQESYIRETERKEVAARTPIDVIALFPADPADYDGKFCTSYQHIGQHSGADFDHIMSTSVPATPAEYAALYHELTTMIGYTLDVCQSRTAAHRAEYKRRLAQARKG